MNAKKLTFKRWLLCKIFHKHIPTVLYYVELYGRRTSLCLFCDKAIYRHPNKQKWLEWKVEVEEV